MSDPIKVGLCFFLYKDPVKEALPSFRRPLDSSVKEVCAGYYGSADPVTERNRALWQVYKESTAEVVIFIDHDQSFPAGTLELLAAEAVRTRGVVGSLIAKKGAGAGLAAVPYQDDDQPLCPGAPGLLRVKAIGTGLMAIHRSVVERVTRSMQLVANGDFELPPMFDHVYFQDGPIRRRLGEDISFCFRCRELGIPIHGAQEPEVGHWGRKEWTWKDAKLPKSAAQLDAEDRHRGCPPPLESELRDAISTSMLRRFNVVTIRPDGYRHSDSFADVSKLLASSLRDLGHYAQESENAFADDATNLVLGANLIAAEGAKPPLPYVVYQLEQLSDREGWATPQYLQVLRDAEEVWDYAPENIAWLKERGIEAKLLPFGYHKALETISQDVAKDIDVLSYGSKNERRAKLVDDLRARGLQVVARWGDCYGEERDALIARAKVVLCCHYYEAQVMEQLRISHLLNNRALVVAEDSKVNPYPMHAVAVAPYERLAAVCQDWAGAPRISRGNRARDGYNWIKAHPMTAYLREVLS